VFTSGADYDKLDAARSDFETAKQNALDHPDDQNAQQKFQEAAQALQLLSTLLSQISQMFASIAENAIHNSKVQGA
jgi:hypothetical protein